MFEFKFKNTYKKARTGFLKTPHGKIKTPNLAIVATHGRIKLLNKTDHLRANPDLIIANTFHLFVNKKVLEIKKAGGLHQWSGFKRPVMTDSGGFQVFSLGWGQIHKTGKILKKEINKKFISINQPKQLRSTSVKISEHGVIFNFDGKKFELTPEKSIKIQKELGADIIFAFDECTSPLHNYTYTKKAMERTHRWAIRCLKEFKVNSQRLIVNGHQQALFGIVQGGIYEDLRRKSSKFIGSLDFDGFGIGGSFGEKQMKEVLKWSLAGLPENKPRHLLGIGKIKDIFIAVQEGIDLFDCVVPTREARHGVLYTKTGKLSIEKGIFARDKKLIDKNCGCWVCRQGITRQEIHYLFKQKRLNSTKICVNPFSNPCRSVSKAKRLSTIHNIYFFKNLFREIREAIVNKQLEKLEKEYYHYIK
jgi:queuine tRNA-ribosyltransferase